MKLRSRAVHRTGPFADSYDLNPWLLPLRHMTPMSSQPRQVGFRTFEERYGNRSLDPAWGIGEEFLASTRMHVHRPEWDASALEYFSSLLGPVLSRSGGEALDTTGAPVELPEPTVLGLPLAAVLDRRRSVREFSGDAINLADLSTILYTMAGISHHGMGVAIDRPVRYALHFRNVPSSGGLYGVDVTCVALAVRGLATGVYRYLPYGHRLAPLTPRTAEADGDQADGLRAPFMQSEAAGVDLTKVAVVLVLSGTPAKVTRKYGDRGVRYLFIEAGMMAFAADLAAAALGWGSLNYQSFYEPQAERLLRLRPRLQYALHSTLVGWPLTDADAGVP